jgi:hypothetical protein
MNKSELETLGKALIAIAGGAEWECLWADGWAHPNGRDIEHCVTMRIPIRLVESDAPNPPESTAQTICDLINEIPEHAIKARIELPAEDLHALALDWHAKNTLLQEIADGVQQSQGKQNDLLAKIKRVTKGGAA